jgi:signal transduction histidine kinase
VDRDVAIHVSRVEALNNVARHSKSTEVDVRLRFSAKVLVLEVEDHGVGFGHQNGGTDGIYMRERAELIHGKVEFVELEKGSLVRLTVPPTIEEVHGA